MYINKKILINFFYIILLVGCANQGLQLSPSLNDPANPNAPEALFTPRPNWLLEKESMITKQPITEAMPATEKITIYTCPMHPEVLQHDQGRCPDCGMRLIPKETIETDSDNKQ
jgi:DNA-directed RNA polymerase subunit RPC12/RpoP